MALALGRHVSTISQEIARCFNAVFCFYLTDYKEKINKVNIVKQLQNAKNKNNALCINILQFNKILCVITSLDESQGVVIQ